MAELAARAAPRRLGLRSRFVVAIAALIALVLAGNTYLLVIDARQERRKQIEQRATSFAKLAVGPACAAYEAYFGSGRSKFREIVRGLQALNPEIDRIALYDVTGRLLFDSRAIDEPSAGALSTPPTGDLLGAVRALDVSGGTVLAANGREIYRIVVPHVEEWGRHRYTLVAETSFAGLRTAIRRAAVRIGLWAVAALALGVGLAGVLAQRSLRPLELLRAGALDLAEGRLDRRIGLASGDEFESLSQALDTMAERLQRSVADLEESNRALSAANEELLELDRLKSDLLANVSHELRTPLTAIQGYNEAMTAGMLGPTSAEQRSALEVVQRNLRRLLAMIEELLASARRENAMPTVRLGPFDLGQLVAEEVTSLRATGRFGVRIRTESEPDLPPVIADRDRIAQVLDNLLDNACKFTPEAGEVCIRLLREGHQVAVEVVDSGIGMAGEVAERVFDRFYQADPTSKRRYGGLGLGLTIVRDILAAHGATIAVQSEAGKGSTFRFALPMAGARDEAATGKRVLVVDASASFLAETAAALRSAGYQVEIAASLAVARERLHGSPPAVAVVSRVLPDGDGFDLVRDRAALGEVIPLLRSRVRDERLARSLRAGGAVIGDRAPTAELLAALSRLTGGGAVES